MRSHDRPKFDPRAQLLQRSMTWKLSIIVRNSHIQNCFNSNGPYKYLSWYSCGNVEGKITFDLKEISSIWANFPIIFLNPQKRNFRGIFLGGKKFPKQRSTHNKFGGDLPNRAGKVGFPRKNPTGPWYFHLTQKPRAEDPERRRFQPDGSSTRRLEVRRLLGFRTWNWLYFNWP